MTPPFRTFLADSLREPARLRGYDLGAWDLLVRQARRAGLLARLAHAASEAGPWEAVPEAPRRHLEGALILADKHRRDVLWEIHLLRRALASLRAPVILLKGAAYVAADLPAARGRIFSDIDILVPRERIDDAEALLLRNGWVETKNSAYDQRYYRRWMHEIPPLRNIERDSVLDVHHTIVSPMGRIPVDAAQLIAARLPTPSGLDILAPADMVLHAALHLFNEAQPERALRDLDDIHLLLRHFAGDPSFWPALLGRAAEIGATPTLRLAVGAAARLFATPVPDGEPARLLSRPRPPGERLVARAFDELLCPDHATCRSALTRPARLLLYVRSHYLRLPLRLLLPHLVRKALMPQPGH